MPNSNPLHQKTDDPSAVEAINAKFKKNMEQAYEDYLNTLRDIEKTAKKEAEDKKYDKQNH